MFFAFSFCSFAQTYTTPYPKNKNGHKTIKHFIDGNKFNYEYNPSINISNDSLNKIGQIVFWSVEPIYDKVSKKYWTPNISYDVYHLSDWPLVKRISDVLISTSNCDSINKGGDIQIVGDFVLVSTSPCVNCANSSNLNYCRYTVKNVLQSVKDKTVLDFGGIVKQFKIKEAKFKG